MMVPVATPVPLVFRLRFVVPLILLVLFTRTCPVSAFASICPSPAATTRSSSDVLAAEAESSSSPQRKIVTRITTAESLKDAPEAAITTTTPHASTVTKITARESLRDDSSSSTTTTSTTIEQSSSSPSGSSSKRKTRIKESSSKRPSSTAKTKTKGNKESRTKASRSKGKTTKKKKSGGNNKRASFHVMVNRLRQFREKHGHCIVSKLDGEPELFKWTHSIRSNYRYQYLEYCQNEENCCNIDDFNNDDSNKNNNDGDDNTQQQQEETKRSSRKRPRLSDKKLALLMELDFCWDRQNVVWQNRYEELCAYREQHGDCRVTLACIEYPKLAVWVQNQRRQYRKLSQAGQKSSLTPKRIKALERVGFEWSGTPQYKQETTNNNNNANNSNNYNNQQNNNNNENDTKNSNSKASTTTIKAQKRRKTTTKIKRTTTTLRKTTSKTKTRSTGSRSASFHAMIDRLRQFRDQHHHSLVNELDGDPELFRWTQSIRKNYGYQFLEKCGGGNTTDDSGSSSSSKVINEEKEKKRKRPRLPDEKMDLLMELDFCWDRKTIVWQKRYEELCAYQEKHGDCQVPRACADFPSLGVWVQNQRREYRRLTNGQKSTLVPTRLEALQRVGFEWSRSHKKAWQQKYKELVAYYKSHGNSNVPQRGNFALGNWCMNQRTARKRLDAGEKTALTPERIQLLNELRFEWNIRDSKWLSRLERLKQYNEENGHTNIPVTDDDENRELRIWLIVQRHHYNRRQQGQASALTQERIDAVEAAIPDFSWKARGLNTGPSVEDWSVLFEELQAKGITPGMRAKKHWFEGRDRQEHTAKDYWSDEDLMELWNQEEDEDDDDYFHDYAAMDDP